MTIQPGTIQGEEAYVGSKTYVWDGVKWSLKSISSGVTTIDVQLSNPVTYRSGRLNLGSDGYPEPQGLTTQSGANEYMVEATDWLKERIGTVVVQSGLPTIADYKDGTLWIDKSTYDLYVLDENQWIHVTGGI